MRSRPWILVTAVLDVAPGTRRQICCTTPTGFEFVKDAQGRVTHVMIRGATGDRRAPRKR